MGAGQSKKSHSTDLTISHPRFQSAKAHTIENKRVMEAYMGGIEKKEYEDWQERVKAAKISEDEEFILMPTQHKFSTEGLCSSSGIATMTYPDYPHLLVDEIEERRATRKYFEEDELWYLLYAFANSKRQLEGKIGDIRPQNVFINDQGRVKIASTLSWPKEPTNYSKAFEDISTYLAPQEVRLLGTTQTNENSESEIFSIGQTLLSVAILEDLTGLADIKLHNFNEGKLQKSLDQLRVSPYSEILKSTIDNMCELNPNERITSSELWSLLEPHEEKIKARQNFVVGNAPNKLHSQVGKLRNVMPILLSTMKQQNQPYQSQPYTLNSGLPVNRGTTIPGTTYSHLYGPQRNTLPIQHATQAESVYVPQTQVHNYSSTTFMKQNNGMIERKADEK